MRAGRLRDRIRIEAAEYGEDAAGAPVKAWAELATVQAQIMNRTGRESNGVGTDVAEQTVQIVMRRIPGVEIDPAMRAIDVRRDHVFDIVGVRPSQFYNDMILDVKRGGARNP